MRAPLQQWHHKVRLHGVRRDFKWKCGRRFQAERFLKHCLRCANRRGRNVIGRRHGRWLLLRLFIAPRTTQQRNHEQGGEVWALEHRVSVPHCLF